MKACKTKSTYVIFFAILLSFLQFSFIASAAISFHALDEAINTFEHSAELYEQDFIEKYGRAPTSNGLQTIHDWLMMIKNRYRNYPAPKAPTQIYPVNVPSFELPSAPTIDGEVAVYAGEYLPITATATDPNGHSIQYKFEWTASKSGATHIVTKGWYASGASCTDQFKYDAKDIGYTYTVMITASNEQGFGPTSYHSFVIMPHVTDFSTVSDGSNTPAPDLNLFNIPSSSSSTVPGETTFEENPVGSVFELYGAAGDYYWLVWIGLAVVFISIGLFSYYYYTGHKLFSTNLKRSVYRSISRSGIKGTERAYDYELTYSMPPPKSKVAYRRQPVRRKIKW